jgi:hypothetical protein
LKGCFCELDYFLGCFQGFSYEFKVAARNSLGFGPLSDASGAVTMGASGNFLRSI